MLEESASRFGDKTALKMKRGYAVERWSYQHLQQVSEGVASYLHREGIGKGECVMVCAPNMPEWVALYFGCMCSGVILVPIDVRSTSDFIASVNDQTAARLIFTSKSVAVDVPDMGVPVVHMEDLPEIVGGLPCVPVPIATDDDIAEVMFTSGTTGEPKGVILTNRNIRSNVEAAIQLVPSKFDHRLLSLLPLSHMMEQTVGLLAPLKGGATVVYPGSRQPRILFETIREEKITTMALVPQVLTLFWNAIEREVVNGGKEQIWNRMLSLASHLPLKGRRLLFRSVHSKLGGHLESFMCGGAYLDTELAKKWELLGIPVLQGYGTTEASPIVATNSMRDRTMDSVGKVLPGQEIRIAQDGEVLIKGANVTRGYWGNPKATDEAFEYGWYRTGDLGYLDAENRLHLHGRKKEMIVLDSGMNVHAQDVEEALKAQRGVRDACVVGMPGSGGRVRVHAVLLMDDVAGSAKSTVDDANKRLAEHQRVRDFTVWPLEDFPRTHTLKVKKHEVVETLLSGEPLEDFRKDSEDTRDSQEDRGLRKLIAEIVEINADAVDPSMTLEDDLGLDSLSRVELLSAIEAEMNVYVDESLITCGTTVEQLEALIASPQEQAQKPKYWDWPLSSAVSAVRPVIQAMAVFPMQKLLMPQVVQGQANLKDVKGPVIFAANHHSHLDTPAVIAAMPYGWRKRTAVAAAADVWFDRGPFQAGLSALLFNAFPFSRSGPVRPSLERFSQLLNQRWSVLIYPEGSRSIDGDMQDFKSGTGLMAIELGVPVVPVHIEGTFEVLSKKQRFPKRSRVQVRFGKPITFSRKTSYEDATREIESAVRDLAPRDMLIGEPSENGLSY